MRAHLGVLIDAALEPARERRLNVALGIGGLTLAGASLVASDLPAIHPASGFWTTSTSFFLLLRVGIMTALVAAANGVGGAAGERREMASARAPRADLVGHLLDPRRDGSTASSRCRCTGR